MDFEWAYPSPGMCIRTRIATNCNEFYRIVTDCNILEQDGLQQIVTDRNG